MGRNNHIITAVLVICSMLMLPFSVLAAGRIDTGRETYLTITYRDGGKALTDAEFDIYRVASVNAYGELTSLDSFRKYDVDISEKDDEAWEELASTLEGYVLRDEISPEDSGKTDKDGKIRFPGEHNRMQQGLYLVMGHRHTQDDRTYDAVPFMVFLPSLEEKANDWQYDVDVEPKFDLVQNEGDTVTRKVLKVWKDDGHSRERPEKVKVQLLRDGKVYDTKTLNKDNNWRYTWRDLDEDYKWTVVEKEVDGYTVRTKREGVTYVVTNTYREDGTHRSDHSGTHTTSSRSDGSGGTKLPQTGQLWWPVPVLVAAGLLMIVFGLIRRRETEYES